LASKFTAVSNLILVDPRSQLACARPKGRGSFASNEFDK
jgi:hypothetical protein